MDGWANTAIAILHIRITRAIKMELRHVADIGMDLDAMSNAGQEEECINTSTVLLMEVKCAMSTTMVRNVPNTAGLRMTIMLAIDVHRMAVRPASRIGVVNTVMSFAILQLVLMKTVPLQQVMMIM